MHEKVNVLYDVEILKADNNKDGSRSGIFFVAVNVLKYLDNNPLVDCYYYCKADDRDYFSNYFQNNLRIDCTCRILTDKDDLTHIDAFISPVFAKPSAICKYSNITCYNIIYDLVPLLFPQHYREIDQSWFHTLIKSINKNDFYFAISKHTKQDFIQYIHNIDSDKITVIPLSTAGDFHVDTDQNKLRGVKCKYNIPENKKYLFSLCSLEPRKNLIRAVQAFIEFIEKNEIDDLVYVLGGGAWAGFIEKLEKDIPDYRHHKDKIIRAGYVSDEDLSILYSNAEWFVYTSEYEGFGMPPLEAMQCGCPVVVSNNSSLPEVVDQTGIRIDFDSVEQHIDAYERYYFDKTLREYNAQQGLLQAQKFNWHDCVDTIVNKILEVEHKKESTPLVTIVTITYNLIKNGRQDKIKQCLDSVRKQAYSNYEHIIIDGASTDGTLELLKEYEDIGWIKIYSEPDKGVYDAMNKGIDRANGKYTNFLNSDDYFHNDKAIALSVQYLEKCSADYSFADTKMILNDGKIVVWQADISKLMLSAHYCHQSMFVKTAVLRELGGFDLAYKISSDSDMMIRLYARGFKYVVVPVCFVTYRAGGLSGQYSTQSRIDHARSFSKHIGKEKNLTPSDCMLMWQLKLFEEIDIREQLELIAKIPQEFAAAFIIEEFIKRNGCADNTRNLTLDMEEVCERKYSLFGFIPIIKYKRYNKKQYYYLFDIVRLLKITGDSKKQKYYLLGFIPIWKVKKS